MTNNVNEIATLGAMYAHSKKRMRARLEGLGVPPTDVEDLRHEVFVVALTRRAAISNESAAAAWLNQACEFVALAYRRKAYRRREIQKQVPESDVARLLAAPAESEPTPPPPERLHHALAALNPLDRDLLALHLAADVPFRTLAELHGCDVKTVRKRFQSAAKRLRRILEVEVPGEALSPALRAPAGPADARPAARETLSFRQLGADASVAIGSIGNVLITSWRGALTAGALELLFAARQDLRSRVGSPIASLAIVDEAWPVPRFDERQRIFQALAFLRQGCAAFSLVGAHSNLRLAEQIMRGLGFLLQMRYPLAASRDLSEAASWLLAQRDVRLAAGQGVEQLVDAARRIEQA